ncbi:MAG: sugar phosphate isomerase/epimerase [Phycisphaerales bacterium]|jgi:hexulose-6-phosphate isomerase|nr:sugar phosphate isomerase/epimerase [Phycisphaerales bacterium]
MIKTISYWSVQGGLEGTRAVNEALADAKSAGFAGLELAIGASGVLTPQTDQATCQRYRQEADRQGVIVQTLANGMTWGGSPTDPDESVRKKAVADAKASLQRAAWLGCQAMLFVPGAVKIPWEPKYGPVRYDLAYKWAFEATRELAHTAEQVNVDLCVENVWNGLMYSPMELAKFIDDIGSKRVGVYFDVGNMMGLHQHPPDWIKILGHRIKRIHIKDYDFSKPGMAGFVDLLAGNVPWAQVMKELRALNYDKTIVAEMMPYDPTLLQRTSAAMDKILAM